MRTHEQPHALPPEADLASEVRIASDALLQEALDYLLRLPAHPMTARLAHKVQRYLSDPGTEAVRRIDACDAARRAHAREVAELRSLNAVFTGTVSYTASGIPTLQLTVQGCTALMSSPAAELYGSSAQGKKFAVHLAQLLSQGIVVELQLDDKRPS